MPRDLTSGLETAINSQALIEFYMVEAEYDNGAYRVTSLPYGHDITWNGKEWTAVGTLLGVDSVTEQVASQSNTVSVSLSGIDNSVIAVALTQYYQGRPGKIYFCIMNADGTFTLEPLLLFSGLIDNQSITIGETATVSLTMRSVLNKALDPREQRYTDQGQQAKFPGDKGFSLVATLPNYTYSWGTFVGSQAYALQRISK